MKTKHYHDTAQAGDKLDEYTRKAITQDILIAEFFELSAGEIFTPWEVRSLAFKRSNMPPITSVRRAMSNLTRAGILSKTEDLKETGGYGRRSHSWILNEKYRETLGLMGKIMAGTEPPDSLNKDISPELKQYITEAVEMTDTDPPGITDKGISPELMDYITEAVESNKEPVGSQLTIAGMGPEYNGILRCGICRRPIKSKRSVELGIGPICYGNCKKEVES